MHEYDPCGDSFQDVRPADRVSGCAKNEVGEHLPSVALGFHTQLHVANHFGMRRKGKVGVYLDKMTLQVGVAVTLPTGHKLNYTITNSACCVFYQVGFC